MKIALHTCCGPCLLYPLEALRTKGHEVTGFFYNPNIHPYAEYAQRKYAVEGLTGPLSCECVYPDYDPQEFFRAVSMQEAAPARCARCWSLRLQKTAQYAKAGGYDAFTTTLLVSPYQDQAVLKETGERAARDTGIPFYYEDFRPGFRKAHDEAKARGVYCQKYCGCLYSETERLEVKEKGKRQKEKGER